jgi:hypothetical protein
LGEALTAFAAGKARPGLACILSDGLDPAAPDALRKVGGRGHDLVFLHVLSALDRDPDLEGDLRLIDDDGGGPVEITANGATLREYQRRLAQHTEALRAAVARSGGRFLAVDCESPLETVLRQGLAPAGVAA